MTEHSGDSNETTLDVGANLLRHSSNIEKLKQTLHSQTIEEIKTDVANLQSEFAEAKKEFAEAKKSFENSRFDLMTVLAVFVGLITYLGLEIQVFKNISEPLIVVGISIFFIASILLFSLTMNALLKNSVNMSWCTFGSPIYCVLLILLILSMVFILFGNYSLHHPGLS